MRSASNPIERALDEALRMTFPASDPVAISVPARSKGLNVDQLGAWDRSPRRGAGKPHAAEHCEGEKPCRTCPMS